MKNAEARAELIPLLEEACRRERESVPDLRISRGTRSHLRVRESGEWLSSSGAPTADAVSISRQGKYEVVKVLRHGTSGAAYLQRDRISLTIGYDARDRYLVLLHELAHIIEWRRRRNGKHDARFWRTAKRLYLKAGFDMDHVSDRESSVYKRAAKHLEGSRTV